MSCSPVFISKIYPSQEQQLQHGSISQASTVFLDHSVNRINKKVKDELKCVAGIGTYLHVFDVKQTLLLKINYW